MSDFACKQRRAALLVLAALCLVALGSFAGPPSTGEALADNLGALRVQDGACFDVTTTAQELFAQLPARIDDAEKGQIRWAELTHADATDASLVVCTALGDNLGGSLTCDLSAAGTATAGILGQYLAWRKWHLHRTPRTVDMNGNVTEAGGVPALYARAASGTVTVCLTVGW